jgi:ubiquinone/menaquinone biosynthesis C-methylase UbiE
MNKLYQKGDPEAFDKNWKTREEAHYNHHTQDRPKNQIQLAFRSHFEVFSEILEQYPVSGNKVIETGCGRGTLSNYFAVSGWDVTLLDYNQSVLDVAKKIFERQDLRVNYLKGDALSLDIKADSYDVVTNIGLLEHFEDIQTVMDEQLRILRPGGWCFSYIVPERPDNVQRYFNWINTLLKFVALTGRSKIKNEKPVVFRSDNFSDRYLDCLDKSKVKNIIAHGMYPLPMISHSPEFPFSLLPTPVEVVLTKSFQFILRMRSRLYKQHGWICDEKIGQAFLVAFQKK